ncbi:hypothetical protein HRbin39_00716 [bacterium HR39]|nr:hypothetical protein HRbin39_00716 [bacterium HR39]
MHFRREPAQLSERDEGSGPIEGERGGGELHGEMRRRAGPQPARAREGEIARGDLQAFEPEHPVFAREGGGDGEGSGDPSEQGVDAGDRQQGHEGTETRERRRVGGHEAQLARRSRRRRARQLAAQDEAQQPSVRPEVDGDIEHDAARPLLAAAAQGQELSGETAARLEGEAALRPGRPLRLQPRRLERGARVTQKDAPVHHGQVRGRRWRKGRRRIEREIGAHQPHPCRTQVEPEQRGGVEHQVDAVGAPRQGRAGEAHP